MEKDENRRREANERNEIGRQRNGRKRKKKKYVEKKRGKGTKRFLRRE